MKYSLVFPFTFVILSGSVQAVTPAQPLKWAIAENVFTTVKQQILPIRLPDDTQLINPADVPLYEQLGYSAWHRGAGLPYEKRTELAPDYKNTLITARLLSFFSISDIHISDKESPAQPLYMGWSALYGLSSAGMVAAYSPSILSTTQVLDAAIQTINKLHEKTAFDFGISLGDAINNDQYNELRWYIDVIDGQIIKPSSGGHVGSSTIDYQKSFKAAGLNKKIPWYQVLGNHDQFWMGSAYETENTIKAHTGSKILNMGKNKNPAMGAAGSGFYMGVIDGSTPYGDVIGAGPQEWFSTPPTVVADLDRRALATDKSSSQNWMKEFFNTTSNPKGHGFTQPNFDNDMTSYSFMPKSKIPLKVIVLDDTCKKDTMPIKPPTNYAAGCLDEERLRWLTKELEDGQQNDQLMIIAAHVPVKPQRDLNDKTPLNLFTTAGVNDDSLLKILHHYPNLILWISGHRHLNVVTAQPYDSFDPVDNQPENSFWEVETSSLINFPQQFRTYDIRRNSDNTISIFVTNVDPAVKEGSPAAKSRGYAIGAARIFGANDTTRLDTTSHAYNAELVKQLSPTMQKIIGNLKLPILN